MADAETSVLTQPPQQSSELASTDAPSSTEDVYEDGKDLSANVTSNPMEEIDEGRELTLTNIDSPIAPSNTPVTAEGGQASPVTELSSDGHSDDGQKEQSPEAVPNAPAANGVEEEGEESGDSTANNQAVTARSRTTRATKTLPKEGQAVNGTGGKESKKNASSGGKTKKREDKGGIGSILRALNTLESPEEKLAALCTKYADLHEENRVLQTTHKTQQRTIAELIKKRDSVSSEHAKAIIAKGRLESLCRELQKHNRLVKEESVQRAKEDDEKRRELSSKFQTTICEIQTQMNNNNERNSKLQEENMALAKQLKQFVEQYENREQKMRQHRDLEQQVAEAKLAKAAAVLKDEQERSGKEKELLISKIAESNKKVSLLEAQVRVFKERYDEFENLHARSNETFQKYKTEMDKMSKRIKKLEKDGLAWKSKWETTNKALIQTTDAKIKCEQENKTLSQKTKTLESLCRALQEKLREKPTAAEAEAPKDSVSPTQEVPPNSPEAPSSGQASPDSSLTPNSEENPSNPPPTAACSISSGVSQKEEEAEEEESGEAEPSPDVAGAGEATSTPVKSPCDPSTSSSPESTTTTTASPSSAQPLSSDELSITTSTSLSSSGNMPSESESQASSSS